MTYEEMQADARVEEVSNIITDMLGNLNLATHEGRSQAQTARVYAGFVARQLEAKGLLEKHEEKS